MEGVQEGVGESDAVRKEMVVGSVGENEKLHPNMCFKLFEYVTPNY